MRIFSSSGRNLSMSRFVISMSNNPSSNCSRHLRSLVMSFQGEISLHFDPPSLYSCRVRIPLLREIIKLRARGLSRYISSCTFTNFLSFLGIEEAALVVDPHSFFTFISNGSAQVHLIDFRFTQSTEMPYACLPMPLGGNFSLNYLGCSMIAERYSSTAKCTISLKLSFE
jgi:hypothetical protein